MKKQETSNTFSDGLIMDLNPLSMPNTALSNCLNGTVLTYNGNENMLQNDMGNARVETAMLPAGYIPVGSTSFGGIIYIVSYNPTEGKCQIGSFPSPERNFFKDELNSVTAELDLSALGITKGFTSSENIINNYFYKVRLLDENNLLHGGDKYKVCFNGGDFNTYISGWDKQNNKEVPSLYPKYLKFELVSAKETGKIIDITGNSIWTSPDDLNYTLSPFYIYNGSIKDDNGNLSLEEYRNVVGCNYDTYSDKSAGDLQLIAKLEVPTTFSVSYNSIISSQTNDSQTYDLYLLLNWTNDNNSDHKSRINPNGILLNIFDFEISNSTDVPDQVPRDSVKLDCRMTKSIELQVLGKNYMEQPTTLHNCDYCTTLFNRDYYLTGELNKFGQGRRNNDGSDYPYIIKAFSIKKENDGEFTLIYQNQFGEQNTKIHQNTLSFDVTPTMPFGRLEFLKQTLNIKLDALGTNEINFGNYQYYVDEDDIHINFSTEIYTTENTTIDGLDMYVTPLRDLTEDQWYLQSTYDNRGTSIVSNAKQITNSSAKHLIDGNPAGMQHITLKRSQLYNSNGYEIYLVQFKIVRTIGTTESNVIYNRLLFNNSTFNNAYGKVNDFKDLYLHDPETNYGMELSLELSETMDQTLSVELDKTLEKYYSEAQIKRANLIATGSQDVSKTVSIASNIPDIEIDFKLDPYSDTKFEPDTENLNTDVSIIDSKSTINVSGTTIHFTDNFKVSTPVTLDYSNVNDLNTYNTQLLYTDSTLSHKLQHWSKEEQNGTFTLSFNYSNYLDDNYNDVVSYPIADETQDTSVFLDFIQSYLLERLDQYKLDYLNVIFGIDSIGDNNCGYGYTYDNSKYFIRLPSKPKHYFVTFTCLRANDGDALIVHKSIGGKYPLTKPTVTSDAGASDFENSNFTLISKSNRYYKYVKLAQTKRLYSANPETITYVVDPIITRTFKLSQRFLELNVNIGSKSIGFIQTKLETIEKVKNLTIIGSTEHQTEFNIKYLIDTQTWYKEFQTINFDDSVYIVHGGYQEKLKVQPKSILSKVYFTSDGCLINNNESSLLEINDKGYAQLINGTMDLKPSTWYFAWEDVGGTEGAFSPESEVLGHGGTQYYKLFSTYNAIVK